MGGNISNLAIVCVAVATYGGLAVAIMRSALRDARRSDLGQVVNEDRQRVAVRARAQPRRMRTG